MNNRGFTLVELLIVLVVMGIFSAISVLVYDTIIDNVNDDLNEIFTDEIERNYKQFLIVEDLEHSDILFQSFMYDYYPDYVGEFSFIDNQIVHKETIEEDESVPFLYREDWMFRTT
jgi:prepilin-type N-terminal cleavage/methylation domain-containing protein